jgi:hypothetical protein
LYCGSENYIEFTTLKSGCLVGKKFAAARLQTRLFAAPHKKVDRPHLQANNTTKTLSGRPAGGVYPPFCEGLQTAWFAAGLQHILFRLVGPEQLLLGVLIWSHAKHAITTSVLVITPCPDPLRELLRVGVSNPLQQVNLYVCVPWSGWYAQWTQDLY